MATAEEFFDDQIATMQELGLVAQRVYLDTASVPLFVDRGVEETASHLAQLFAECAPKLDTCLTKAEDWLSESQSVLLPTYLWERQADSACAGASELLMILWAEIGLHDSGIPFPPENFGFLKEKIQALLKCGIPDKVAFPHFEQLIWLAHVANRECLSAINRLKKEIASITDPDVLAWAKDIVEADRLKKEGQNSRHPFRRKVNQRRHDNPQKYDLALKLASKLSEEFKVDQSKAKGSGSVLS